MLKHTTHYLWGTTLLVIMILILSGCAVPSASSPATGSAAPAASTSASGSSSAAPTAAVPTSAAATTESSATSASAAGSPTAPSSPQATSGIPNSGATPAAGAASPGTIQYVIVPEKSEARYRVREQLVNNDLPNDAIGKTNQISGAVIVKPDGAIDSASSKITVDVTNLQSDRSMRDNFVRRNILGTDQYPQVVFVPTQVSGLPSPLPQSGNVTFKVTGNLTVRDVTKPVTWDVTGTLNGDQATGKATTTFKFEDFNLSQPRVPVVLSLEDHITLEVDVTLQKSAGATSATGNSASAATSQSTAAATTDSIPATGAGASAAAAPSGATAPACTSPAAQTPALTEGPYFKAGSPEQSNLIQSGMNGTKLTLTGYVLNTNCQPIPNALLEFWQADAQGQYDNSGYTLRGHQSTDSAGRYQLTTIIPGLYPGRTEHIHVKVQPPNGAVLTTQLFFPNVSQNQSDGIFDPKLVLNLQDAPDGKQAAFDFVVGQ